MFKTKAKKNKPIPTQDPKRSLGSQKGSLYAASVDVDGPESQVYQNIALMLTSLYSSSEKKNTNVFICSVNLHMTQMKLKDQNIETGSGVRAIQQR